MTRVPLFVLVTFIALGCARTTDPRAASPSPTAQRPLACSTELPWVATYVPAPLDPVLEDGPGGGAAPVPGRTELHHEGSKGVYVNVIRGEPSPDLSNAEDVEVLGEPAKLGRIEDGYAIAFTHGGTGRCDRYRIEAFGIDRRQVEAFAEGISRGTSAP